MSLRREIEQQRQRQQRLARTGNTGPRVAQQLRVGRAKTVPGKRYLPLALSRSPSFRSSRAYSGEREKEPLTNDKAEEKPSVSFQHFAPRAEVFFEGVVRTASYRPRARQCVCVCDQLPASSPVREGVENSMASGIATGAPYGGKALANEEAGADDEATL